MKIDGYDLCYDYNNFVEMIFNGNLAYYRLEQNHELILMYDNRTKYFKIGIILCDITYSFGVREIDIKMIAEMKSGKSLDDIKIVIGKLVREVKLKKLLKS